MRFISERTGVVLRFEAIRRIRDRNGRSDPGLYVRIVDVRNAHGMKSGRTRQCASCSFDPISSVSFHCSNDRIVSTHISSLLLRYTYLNSTRTSWRRAHYS